MSFRMADGELLDASLDMLFLEAELQPARAKHTQSISTIALMPATDFNLGNHALFILLSPFVSTGSAADLAAVHLPKRGAFGKSCLVFSRWQ